MAGATDERTSGTTSWDAAPVVSGRHRRGWSWVLVSVVLAVAAGVLLSTDRRPEADGYAPTAPGRGFDVTVRVADVARMDDDGIFGRRPVQVDDRAVGAAARDISRLVTRYLDAAFVSADTRFSAEPVASLLDARARRAARDADLRGLGVVDTDVRDVAPHAVLVTVPVIRYGDVPTPSTWWPSTSSTDGRPSWTSLATR